MRVVIAPDKFKGSLSASEAAHAMARGVHRANPRAQIKIIPMADGGEGTVEALVAATNGTFHEAAVTGPMGEPRAARFGLLSDRRTAVIEMASASGLVLVSPADRDPLRASTRGTGELLLAAIDAGANCVIIGIGGSATNDGGAGLAQALGYRLLDEHSQEIGPGGGELHRLARIDSTSRNRAIDAVEILVACDVTNPLCGPNGASAVYGPQKGASPEQVAQLDRNLEQLAAIIQRDLGEDVRDLPGAGAAGGLGAGLVAFANARLAPGVGLVADAVQLASQFEDADLCLTGEGSIDNQSAQGKTAVGVARIARERNCPVIAIAGMIGEGAEAVLAEGIDAYFSCCPAPITLDEAIHRAGEFVERTTEQAVRAFLIARKRPF